MEKYVQPGHLLPMKTLGGRQAELRAILLVYTDSWPWVLTLVVFHHSQVQLLTVNLLKQGLSPRSCKQPDRNKDIPKRHLSIRLVIQWTPRNGNFSQNLILEGGEGLQSGGNLASGKRFHTVQTTHLPAWDWHSGNGGSLLGRMASGGGHLGVQRPSPPCNLSPVPWRQT